MYVQSKKAIIIFILLLLIGFTSGHAQQTGTISGTVVNASNEQPLSGVNVAIVGTAKGTVTNENGQFQITNVQYGDKTLQASFVGFKTISRDISISAASTSSITIEMQPDVLQLGSIRVSSLRPHQLNETNIDESQVDEANIQDTGGLLRNIPGVSAVRRGPQGLDPVIRGLRETEVGAYVDGTRTFPAGPARMDSPLSHIDPSAIKNVKILKGPYALTWGAGNMSAIQIETQPLQSLRNSFSGRLSSGYDSNINAFEESASIRGRAGKFGYWVNGAWREGDNYTAGNGREIPGDFKSREIRGKLGYAVTDHSFVDVTIGYQKQDDIDYPGRLLNASFFETYNYAANWEWTPQNSLFTNIEGNIYYNDVDHAMNNDDKPTGQPAPNRMPPFALDIGVNAASKTSGGRFAATLQPAEDLLLEVGGDVYRSNRDATRTISRRDNQQLIFFDIIWPDAVIADGGVFTKADYTINEKWTASATARVDFVHADGDSVSQFFANNISTNLDANETNLNGAFTLNYIPTDNWTLGVGLGSVVRTADALERYSDRFPASKSQTSAEFIGNPQLDPERNTQVDLWVDARYAKWNASLNIFARQMDDYITIAPTNLSPRLPLSPPTVFQYINGDAQFGGFDASAAYRLVPQLNLKTGLSYLYAQDTELDEPALGITPFKLNTGLRYESSSQPLFAEATLNLVSEQDRVATSRGETPTDSYTTADLNAGVTLWQQLSVQAGIRNITDQNYVNHLNAKNPFTGQRIPEAGRIIHVDVSLYF